jgi:hypothetical protein
VRKLRPCSIRGVAYASHAAAAAALGLTRQRIHQLAAQTQEHRTIRARVKPVTIDGVTYASMAEAAGALGVSYWVARYLARSGTATRRARRPTNLATTNARREHPPTRNAVKLLRRMTALLDSSIWIKRLPAPRRRAIGKARHILDRQADLLAQLHADG